jgi:hypothetical protein
MEVTLDPTTNAILPQFVRLTCTDGKTKMEMNMRLRDIQSTRLEPERAARLFSRRDLSSFPGFDLATQRPDRPDGYSQGTSLQRVGGTAPGRNGGW